MPLSSLGRYSPDLACFEMRLPPLSKVLERMEPRPRSNGVRSGTSVLKSQLVSDKVFNEEDALTHFREAIRKMLSRPVERVEAECWPAAAHEDLIPPR